MTQSPTSPPLRAPILMIGVERTLEFAIRRVLSSSGHEVLCTGTVLQGLEIINESSPGVLILGGDLPAVEGCRFSRQVRTLPVGCDLAIVFLSDRDTLADKLAAFAAGADDYITLPCSMPELALRVNALLRRFGAPARHAAQARLPVEPGDLLLDAATGELRCGSRTTQLTPVETRILEYLLACKGRPVSSAELAKHVWDRASTAADLPLVRVHIRNLRLKLALDLAAPQLLTTVASLGYRIAGCQTG